MLRVYQLNFQLGEELLSESEGRSPPITKYWLGHHHYEGQVLVQIQVQVQGRMQVLGAPHTFTKHWQGHHNQEVKYKFKMKPKWKIQMIDQQEMWNRPKVEMLVETGLWKKDRVLPCCCWWWWKWWWYKLDMPVMPLIVTGAPMSISSITAATWWPTTDFLTEMKQEHLVATGNFALSGQKISFDIYIYCCPWNYIMFRWQIMVFWKVYKFAWP